MVAEVISAKENWSIDGTREVEVELANVGTAIPEWYSTPQTVINKLKPVLGE